MALRNLQRLGRQDDADAGELSCNRAAVYSYLMLLLGFVRLVPGLGGTVESGNNSCCLDGD